MSGRPRLSSFAALLALTATSAAIAGMPSPLPSDPQTVLRLNDTVLQRLETISFFLAVLLVSALAFRFLWNFVRRDFPKLPRMTFLKALGVVLLWGLLFIIVLTMISGARELMTPGAWVKQGFTYKLVPDPRPEEPSSVDVRKKHLDQLRQALWHYAATHDGQFPAADHLDDIGGQLWNVPETGGLRYLYVGGRRASDDPAPLAYEPELDSEQRFVLLTNGDVVAMRSAEIVLLLNGEKRP
jgi:hypothetical protein